MDAFIHPDESRPSVTLKQLVAIDAMVRRSVPSDVTVVEVAVLPSRPGHPAPLEVRATIAVADTPLPGENEWAQTLATEVRHGWDREDFTFALCFVPPA